MKAKITEVDFSNGLMLLRLELDDRDLGPAGVVFDGDHFPPGKRWPCPGDELDVDLLGSEQSVVRLHGRAFRWGSSGWHEDLEEG